jgi:hypothetical protein
MGSFADGCFADETFRRQDVSPTRRFADMYILVHRAHTYGLNYLQLFTHAAYNNTESISQLRIFIVKTIILLYINENKYIRSQTRPIVLVAFYIIVFNVRFY